MTDIPESSSESGWSGDPVESFPPPPPTPLPIRMDSLSLAVAQGLVKYLMDPELVLMVGIVYWVRAEALLDRGRLIEDLEFEVRKLFIGYNFNLIER